MKNDWDPKLSKKIKAEYEEAQYPLPDIDSEWEKFSAKIPETKTGIGIALKTAGVLSVFIVAVVVGLLTGNKLNPTVQKENIKTLQQTTPENADETVEMPYKQSPEIHANRVFKAVELSNNGADKANVYQNKSNAQLTQNNNNSPESEAKKIASQTDDFSEKSRVESKEKEEVNNDPVNVVTSTLLDTGNDFSLMKATQQKEDSAKSIKPSGKKLEKILRLELFLNGTNAITPVQTYGGGLVAGIRGRHAGVSSGVFVGNGNYNLGHLSAKREKIHNPDSISNYVYQDSSVFTTSNHVYFAIPIEFSYKMHKNWEAYTRARTDILFSQRYHIDHYNNLEDSFLPIPTVASVFTRKEQETGSLRSVTANIDMQVGLRYSYKQFTLGLAGSLPLYRGSLASLEQHFEQEGFRVGQRAKNGIFYTFSLGYNF